MNQRTIAVVDDDEAVQDSLRSVLEAFGYRVTAHSSGNGLLDALADGQPDCVILDVNLPEMSGWEVLARIRSSDGALPVILTSGHEGAAGARRAARNGAHAFIDKPIRTQHLLSAIDEATGGGG